MFHFETKQPTKLGLITGMTMNQFMLPALKPGEALWGIYFTDREYAREKGDPLRAVVAAPTKVVAEESAVRLGLDSPWAHPLTAEQIKSIRESATQRPEQPLPCNRPQPKYAPPSKS